jgi:hypothetical protein
MKVIFLASALNYKGVRFYSGDELDITQKFYDHHPNKFKIVPEPEPAPKPKPKKKAKKVDETKSAD